ncbi:MAG: indolepyruvate oxidoreductase subunit beta [Ruminococcus sp.]|jgi:indolepyruvate ferredoxin oxidoreductase beta subunit|nr:indolepyruvate oxidoreductase subunit beta [Ruminococcus sp.]
MNILICGVGGQGTILASKILAESAVIDGSDVARTGETIGMSQRGGSVVSHVRTEKTSSPYIPKGQADLIIAFEKCEAARCLPFLKPSGKAVVSMSEIKPVAVSLGVMAYDSKAMEDYIKSAAESIFLDTDTLAAPFMDGKCTNTLLLGAAFGMGFINISENAIKKAMEKLIKPRFLDVNIKAFEAGIKAVSG